MKNDHFGTIISYLEFEDKFPLRHEFLQSGRSLDWMWLDNTFIGFIEYTDDPPGGRNVTVEYFEDQYNQWINSNYLVGVLNDNS